MKRFASMFFLAKKLTLKLTPPTIFVFIIILFKDVKLSETNMFILFTLKHFREEMFYSVYPYPEMNISSARAHSTL